MRLLFLKLKQKKNMKKHFFTVFISKLKNALFGDQTIFFIFLYVLAFKTIDKQMLFWSIFFKMHKKNVIKCKKRQKLRFWWSITFFLHFQKYRPKEHLCVYCFKAESKPKHEKTNLGVGFLQKPKTHFFRGPKSQISNLYFCVYSLM